MATPISSTNISIAMAPTWRSSTRTTGDGRPGLPSDSGAASITRCSDSSSPTRPAIALRVRPVAATNCERDDGPWRRSWSRTMARFARRTWGARTATTMGLHCRREFVIVVNKSAGGDAGDAAEPLTRRITGPRPIMSTPFFPDVDAIRYEGLDSDNPLAFRWYDADRVVAGRTMAEHLRFAVCYWHSFNWDGFDIFGAGTLDRPWLPTVDPTLDPMVAAKVEDGRRVRVRVEVGRAVLLLPRPRHRPGGCDVRRVVPQPRRDGRARRRAPGAHRRAAAVGHRQPVLEPSLPGRRGHQPRPGTVRLRRGPDRALHGGDAPSGWSQLRAVGRSRGLRDAAQHRHAAARSTSSAGSSTWSSSTSTRSGSRARS